MCLHMFKSASVRNNRVRARRSTIRSRNSTNLATRAADSPTQSERGQPLLIAKLVQFLRACDREQFQMRAGN